MSNEMQQFTPFDGYGSEMVEYTPNPGVGRPAAQADAPAQGSMVRKIHNSLRGRYWIGLVIGTVLGGVGGYFGWQSQLPIFRGEGMIRIALNKPSVTARDGEGSFMPNFEEFLQSQAMLITSQTIIDNAMRGNNWKATGLGVDPIVKNQIATNLTVEHPSRTELIRVYYTDKNPDLAVSVVKAVVFAYNDYASNKNTTDDSSRLDLLYKRQTLFLNQINRLEGMIVEAGDRMGGGDLGVLVESKIAEEAKIETRLHETELALDAAKRKKDPSQAINDLSERQIGIIDQFMRTLLSERESIMQEMARLTAAGLLPGNSKMKQLQSMLDGQQKKIDSYVLEWRDLQLKVAENPALASGGGIARILMQTEGWLQGEVTALRAKFEEVQKGRMEIGRQMLKIQEFQRQRDAATKEQESLQTRIYVLQLEGGMASRLSIIQPGDVPIVPFKDRRKMFCAAGVLGGFGLPMAFLVFIGLMDKRYRYSDETNDGVSNVPLLGILPRLPEKLSDPEQAAVAAHCIHQIRIMLQVGQNPDKRRSFMVTSASTGDGKTSLTMALGLSFAASGSKTLVIDCDMVGQGLTHRLKAHDVPGLIETLNLGTLRGHVRKTATKGLYILPIGNADAVHAGVLSPQSIKRLMAACREHFDIVVIDTGPILGSLEASVVAMETDGVIVAVARGQQQPLVEKAIKHLRSVGANIFGIVFNRAEARDFQRSVASASIRSISAHQNEPRHLLPDTDESARFGPLARSVASCLPSSSTHGNGNGNGNGHGHGDSAS